MPAIRDSILIDTSVWVDFFRTRKGADIVESMLKNNRASVCGIIITELIRGARSNTEMTALEDLQASINIFPETAGVFKRAGKLGSLLSRKGSTISTVDLVIAGVCLEYDLTLFSYDKHFKTIAEHTDLKLMG